jgi:hypothetical protein
MATIAADLASQPMELAFAVALGGTIHSADMTPVAAPASPSRQKPPTTETAMHYLSRVLLLATLTVGVPGMVLAQSGDISKVNGAVLVEAGQSAGAVSTVNGSVHVDTGAHVRAARTVNGSIQLDDRATADTLDTVNGSISLGANSRVKGAVSAVNGRMQLAPGAEVGGKLGNVNGTITLDRAHVGGGIETVSGDITVGADSRVEGGILVNKLTGWFHWNTRTPQIVIGPHAVVQGTLEFRREVVLKVSDSAQIGPVKGATVVKFSGAAP